MHASWECVQHGPCGVCMHAVQDQPKTAAPSATTYELRVSKASTSSSSWADAALAGLPPDDEAVQMAELAATAGRSIEV